MSWTLWLYPVIIGTSAAALGYLTLRKFNKVPAIPLIGGFVDKVMVGEISQGRRSANFPSYGGSLFRASNLKLAGWQEIELNDNRAVEVLNDLRSRDMILGQVLPDNRRMVTLFSELGFHNLTRSNRPNNSSEYLNRRVNMGDVIVVDNGEDLHNSHKELMWKDNQGKIHMAVTYNDQLMNHTVGDSITEAESKLYTKDMEAELTPQTRILMRKGKKELGEKNVRSK